MTDRQQSISPEHFSSYLRSRSWRPVDTWRGMVVWERDVPESDQVLVPAEGDERSVRRLLKRAIVDLAAVEERPLEDLLSELEAPDADTQRFRLFPPTPSGTIPFIDGRKAIDAIYHLLRDSGRNVDEGHKLLYQDRASEPVYRFLDRVQLGLTAPGSYIFTTSIAKAARTDGDQSALFELEAATDTAALSDHEIVVRLHGAVNQAHAVAKKLLERREISDLAEVGLSANFCKALGDLGGSNHDRPFEIDFDWGFGRAQSPPGSALRFTDRMAAKIHDFGVRLEELAKTGSAVIEGKVIGLYTEEAGYRRRVQIKGRIQAGEEQYDGTLWAFVTESDYDRAIEAHRASEPVRAQGELHLENSSLRLYLGSDGFEVQQD
ncbi:hypothetical protein [Glycomyces tritici]|uniref:Uncharacterized protein n=1 Tax=Glycomyces tritici TaxID=2665176 RepID=A0ABT7YXR7_9ACTN|nr:hypothetical protein [Glycomyces tritici]MDN3243420.1 hypothetical protein [Glycomyces tritici]